MKLWTKGLEPNAMVEKFTVGKDRELDILLAKHDITGSIAHCRMLKEIGLLSSEELHLLLPEMEKLLHLAEQGGFVIEEGVEDVHSQVELMLTRALGDVGKKIHAGRSRNDQVLVDMKLFMREEIRGLAEHAREVFEVLQTLSEKHRETLMPGYTHLQLAMPSSFGLWFGAYAECLVDDLQLLAASYKIANQNPLGSAAGYGNSFPLNRTLTTELLGFETLHYNVIAAQMSRGKTERALAVAMAAIAATLGRFSMDICLYMCQNMGFISFPDELTTGSSIMPHKKNPDVFELMRGKCNRLQALPNELALVCTNLPSGYHREMQLLKEILFPAIQDLRYCMEIMCFMLPQIRVKKDILENPMYDYLFTVEDVNRLALSGVPFRDAYKTVGLQVQSGEYKPTRTVKHTHEGSISNLCNDKIKNKLEKVFREFE